MGDEPSDMKLPPGHRLRAIFRPNNHGPGFADPSEQIEEFQSIARALAQFGERARFQRGLFYAAGKVGPPEPMHWPDGDETAEMEVWVVRTGEGEGKGEKPSVPDGIWQRWTWGEDGQIHRETF